MAYRLVWGRAKQAMKIRSMENPIWLTVTILKKTMLENKSCKLSEMLRNVEKSGASK
jgi:hypothetical protein